MDSALTSPLAQDDARAPRPLLIARWLLLVATAAGVGLLASLVLFWALVRSRGR